MIPEAADSRSQHPRLADSPTDRFTRLGAGVVRGLAQLPARGLVLLIRIYQVTLSPVLPIITMGRCGCRFAPTCSHYAVEAIRLHGFLRGVALAAVRLAKCTPLHPGGLDPVPPRGLPVCRRVDLPSLGTPSSAR